MPRARRRWVSYDRAKLERARHLAGSRGNRVTRKPRTVVGEIYEKGLGTAPRLCARRELVSQGGRPGPRAREFNLGTLYEQGLGVEKDALQALNLYRSAGGLEGDVGYEEAYRRELEQQRAELEKAIEARPPDRCARAADRGARAQARAKGSASAELTGQIASLNALLAQLRREREGSQTRLTALPPSRTREPSAGRLRIQAPHRRRRHTASLPGSVLDATTRS